jgi:hypothetical protein
VSARSRRWAMLAVLVSVAFGVLAAGASAASSHRYVFHPRSGNALGLEPPLNHGKFESSEDGIYSPGVYHGGPTMTGGVTVHTVFWGPANHPFTTAAPPGAKAYVPLIEQFFSDVSAASTGTSGQTCTQHACNAFTIEAQYGWGTSPGKITHGDNTINYTTAADAVMDTHPYPANGCTSPGDTTVCLTDTQIQAEVSRLIQSTPGKPRGLHNLWFVFLPSTVDECDGQDVCGTNAFAGYHSTSNYGNHGLTIYAIAIDPLIEVGGFPLGQDPEGNPDAESTLDTAAHETNEAMSDPEGTGWMDPNGFELADKCEVAPNRGNILGFAGPDHAPYNQVINGHQYLIQEMWSNADRGCVQATTATTNDLPLPQIHLTQFSNVITGNTENNTAGIHVKVQLLRGAGGGQPDVVATGSGTTAGNGTWSAALSGGHAVGDDRDEVVVDYSGTKAPHNDVILTGDGGNPFTLSGWTGWTALDQGNALTNHDPARGGRPSLSIGPCFQVGVLTYAGASGPEPANPFCGAISNVADVALKAPVGRGQRVTVTSLDNRAFAGPNLPGGGNLNGALVAMTVPVGEPDAAPNAAGSIFGFTPSGMPTCEGDLETGKVGCTGLVPGERYSLRDGARVVHSQASPVGEVVVQLGIRRGDQVALSNGARTLTTLHVAHLQVDILGTSRSLVNGRCSQGDYWRFPLAIAPTNSFAGEPSDLFGGSALTGVVCPPGGDAQGMPTKEIAQTDDRSGGATITGVAQLFDITPVEGEVLYGKFIAVAEASGGSSRVSFAITKEGGHKTVFRAANVDKRRGVAVRALPTGRYTAYWLVRDRNGDAREYITRFVEERAATSTTTTRHQHG